METFCGPATCPMRRVTEGDDVLDSEPAALARRRPVPAEIVPSSKLRLTSTSGRPRAIAADEWLDIEARGGGDEAVDLTRQHRLDLAALASGVVVGVDQQRRVARETQSRSSIPRTIGGNSGLVRSGISTPTVNERLVFSPRAIELGRYPSSLGGGEHTGRGLLVDEPARLLVQCARHGAGVDLGQTRHIPDRGARHPSIIGGAAAPVDARRAWRGSSRGASGRHGPAEVERADLRMLEHLAPASR